MNVPVHIYIFADSTITPDLGAFTDLGLVPDLGLRPDLSVIRDFSTGMNEYISHFDYTPLLHFAAILPQFVAWLNVLPPTLLLISRLVIIILPFR